MDFDGVDCFFKKNGLDFNCDADVIVTNIWFCADIISTPVDKDNKSYPTPPRKICILFSRDFERENLSLKNYRHWSSGFIPYNIWQLTENSDSAGYIRLGSAGVWPEIDFNTKLPSKQIELSA